MSFVNPYYLLLLIPVVPYVMWYVLRHGRIDPVLQVSSIESFRHIHRSWREHLMHVPMILRCICYIAAVVALARPQSIGGAGSRDVEGIDIMLCMDVSTSMLAEDFQPNRIEAAKQVASEFIKSRPNDNIGLTIFAGEAFTQCPLTNDHSALFNMLRSVKCDIAATGLIEDGTAVGMGIANSVSRLKDSKAKSKVIIMLTDGTNNRGDISPQTAAEIAKSFGIRVYTIGVGTNGEAPYPVNLGGIVEYTNVPVEIDEKSLGDIASTTDGRYYRATDDTKLKAVYAEIDKLEKTRMQVEHFGSKSEDFIWFALLAVFCLCLELVMRYTILRRIP